LWLLGEGQESLNPNRSVRLLSQILTRAGG
jgi:hypothetical protein